MVPKVMVLFIVLFSILMFCGCEQISETISISEINTHPNKYLNKTVKIKAFYEIGFLDETGRQWHTLKEDLHGSPEVLKCFLNESVDESILIQNGEYYFYGTILWENESIYLLVNKIETI